MTLSKEIKLIYKEINKMMNEINKNIILLIEKTNKILDYTFNKIKIERSKISSIQETLDNINREKGISEDENIFKIKEILRQLESLLYNEENNRRSITIKDIEELFDIKPKEIKQLDKIINQEPIVPSILLIEPISSWRG